MDWSKLDAQWLNELETDPAYEAVITPLLLEVLGEVDGRRYLDLGSGDGRVMKAVGARGADVYGVDLNPHLASGSPFPVVVAELPELAFFARDSFDGAYCVLALEHIADHQEFFRQTAEVVRPGGSLALVMNHPMWTAPGSTPITDSDGEVLWRSGGYFTNGASEVPLGSAHVTFHHRSTGQLLTSAAETGWTLRRMLERPHHEFGDQSGIARLLACRWELRKEP